jgi:poly(hydroxyalkanoate) depolymerase family esterase
MNRRPASLPIASVAGLAAALAACSSGPPEPVARSGAALDTLSQVATFGANPGKLLMYQYAPSAMPPNAPLVVALHGCGEQATDYEAAGWDALAEASKFYVLYPQQQSSNNVEGCFDWFGDTQGSTADITRGQGEAESIVEMIDAMKSAHSIDPKRVYMTGFSAGAAYAVAMLAMYPDVFAGGASFEGVPFGCATTLTGAYTCMSSPPQKTPAQWAQLARAAYPGYAGPYPRLSVWEGSSDTTVATANATAIVAQWTALAGVSQTATKSDTVGGYPHDEYADAAGNVLVESYSITGMAHAVAIDASHGCGTAGAFFVDKQICAVGLAADFFGLTGGGGSSGGGSSGSTGSGGGGSGGTSSGGSSGGGGAGSGSGGHGGASGSGSGAGGSSGSAADAPDGGAGAPATMPGCAMAAPPRGDGDWGWVVAGLALGLTAFVRRNR